MAAMNLLRIVPLITALIAFGMGWLAGGGQYLIYLLPLAAINVFILAPDRLRQVREADPVGGANPIAEGAFLFILQLAILGFAYLLGFFFANAVPLLSLR